MILDDLAAFFVGAGLATVGVDLFLDDLPDSPDSAAVIREYGGLPPRSLPQSSTFSRPAPSMEAPRVQLKVRDFDYQAARLRAERFYQALMGVQDLAINGTPYKSLTPLQQPFSMGRDSQQRSTVGFNIEAVKELSPLP